MNHWANCSSSSDSCHCYYYGKYFHHSLYSIKKKFQAIWREEILLIKAFEFNCILQNSPTADCCREYQELSQRKVMFLNKQLWAVTSSSLHYSCIFISHSFLPLFVVVGGSFIRMFSNEFHERHPQAVLIFFPSADSGTWSIDHLYSVAHYWVV